MPPYKTIKLEIKDNVANILLNRPQISNPIDAEAGYELNLCMDEIDKHHEVEIIVFRGAGKAFSAGGNFEDEHSLSTIENDTRSLAEKHTQAVGMFIKLIGRLENSDKVVIGVVHGALVGGAFEFVLSFDMILVAEEAKVGDAHIRAGHIPGLGGMQRVARIIGPYKAKEMLMTGRLMTGVELHTLGLATYCVPAAQLEASLAKLVERLSGNSFHARRMMKSVINAGTGGDLESGIRLEQSMGTFYAVTAADAMEGFSALREKRKPIWRRPGQS